MVSLVGMEATPSRREEQFLRKLVEGGATSDRMKQLFFPDFALLSWIHFRSISFNFEACPELCSWSLAFQVRHAHVYASLLHLAAGSSFNWATERHLYQP